MKTNLVLPSNFVELDNEEMMYVDGGIFNHRVYLDITFTASFKRFVASTAMSVAVGFVAAKVTVALIASKVGIVAIPQTIAAITGIVAFISKYATSRIASNLPTFDMTIPVHLINLPGFRNRRTGISLRIMPF